MLLIHLWTPIYFCLAQITSPYNFKFQTYTVKEGLVHNTVKKCCADSKGFLWIITENGLSRFDGYQFKNFQSDPLNSKSLPNNFLLDIAIDNQDRIWLSYRNGLCYYDQSEREFKNISNLEKFSTINNLAYDQPKNCLWFFCKEGLYKLNLQSFKISTTSLSKQIYKQEESYSITLDSKGIIWIPLTRSGYYSYDTNKDVYKNYATKCWPMNFYEDEEKQIWINTWQSGFQKFDNASGQNLKTTYLYNKSNPYDLIFTGTTTCAILTGSDVLWVSSLQGLLLFSKSKNEFIYKFTIEPIFQFGITKESIFSVYKSIDNTIWLCSAKGLLKINPNNQQFQSAEMSELNIPMYNVPTGIQDDPTDSNSFWMGINACGVAKYNKKTNQIKEKIYFISPDTTTDVYYNQRWVSKLFIDKNKTIWAPSYGGLTEIKNGKHKFIEVKDNSIHKYIYTSDAYQAKDGKIWMAYEGFASFDPDTYKAEIFRFKNPNDTSLQLRFTGIREAENGFFYLTTAYGLFKFDTHANKLYPISYFQSSKDVNLFKNLYAIESIGNHLYLASAKGLIDYNTETKAIHQIAVNMVNTLALSCLKKDQQGKLWIYSTQGLFVYNPIDKRTNRFSEADGVYNTSMDIAYFFEYKNNMYLGHRMAYTKFDTKDIVNNLNKAVPYITDVKLQENKLLEISKNTIDFPAQLLWNENNLRFEFTAIEYGFPENISFNYQLVGFDKNWQNTNGNRLATYTNLPAGNYVFRVEATNSSGLKNEVQAKYYFTIDTAFWNTWWFKTLLFLFLTLLAIFFVSRRIKKIKTREAKNTENNQKIAFLEMKTLRSRMNPHFIFNSLNSIQKFIWENKKDDASDYLSKFAKLMRMILDFSAQPFISIQDEVNVLQLYIDLEKRRCNNSFDYELEIDENINRNTEKILPLILQPFVENSIWHGLSQLEDRKGKLFVSIKKESQYIICIIEDNGIGRVKAAEIKSKSFIDKRSFGINITEQRLQQLSDNPNYKAIKIVDLYDDIGSVGTKFILTLPEIKEPNA